MEKTPENTSKNHISERQQQAGAQHGQQSKDQAAAAGQTPAQRQQAGDKQKQAQTPAQRQQTGDKPQNTGNVVKDTPRN